MYLVTFHHFHLMTPEIYLEITRVRFSYHDVFQVHSGELSLLNILTQ